MPHRFDGPLGDHFVGPTWRDADFRISFAKNKTHTWAWYTLCLKNIYGVLPLQDKIREYHNKREIYYPTIDMMVAFPIHFGVIPRVRQRRRAVRDLRRQAIRTRPGPSSPARTSSPSTGSARAR